MQYVVYIKLKTKNGTDIVDVVTMYLRMYGAHPFTLPSSNVISDNILIYCQH